MAPLPPHDPPDPPSNPMVRQSTYLSAQTELALQSLMARGHFRSRNACLTAIIHALAEGRVPSWVTAPADPLGTTARALSDLRATQDRTQALVGGQKAHLSAPGDPSR